MRNPVRRAPFSQDLDRRAASKRAQKRGGCAQPYARDTVFPGFRSWRRLRKGHITNIIVSMRLLLAGGFRGERGGTRSGYKGGKGESVIWPTTNEQPRAVMRNSMRDPTQEIDLMVLGDVGASTLRERRRGAGQGGDGAGHGIPNPRVVSKRSKADSP